MCGLKVTVRAVGVAVVVAAASLSVSAADSQTNLADWAPEETLAVVFARPSQLIAETELEILGNVPFLGESPVPPTQIQAAVVLVAADPLTGGPATGLVLRTHGTVFVPTVVKWLLGPAAVDPSAGIPTYRATSSFGTFRHLAIPDEKTVVVASTPLLLTAMLERQPSAGLSTRLRDIAPSVAAALIVDVGKLRSVYDHPLMVREPGTPLGLLSSIPREVGLLAMECRFGKRSSEVSVTVTRREGVRNPGLIESWLPTFDQTASSLLNLLTQQVKTRLSTDDGQQVNAMQAVLVSALTELKAERAENGSLRLHARVAPVSRLGKQAAKMLLPIVQMARNSARAMQASNQFKQVALAWMNYADKNQVFPGDTSSAKGMPLLSWRVGILPFLGSDELKVLHAEFKQDEPWNSPHNIKLIDRMPTVYASVTEPRPGQTRIQGISGAGCLLPGPTTHRSFIDGTSLTLLLVEAAQPVPWTKPEDVSYSPSGFFDKLQRNFAGETLVTFADGATRRLPQQSDQFYTSAALLADGGVLQERESSSPGPSPGTPEGLEKLQLACLFLNVALDHRTYRELLQHKTTGTPVPEAGPLSFEYALNRLLEDEDADVRTASLLFYFQHVDRTAIDWKRVEGLVAKADPSLRMHLLQFISRGGPMEAVELVVRHHGSAMNRAVAVETLRTQFAPATLVTALGQVNPANAVLLCEALQVSGSTEQLGALNAVAESAPAKAAAKLAVEKIRKRATENDQTFQLEQSRLNAQRRALWNEGQAALRAAKPADGLQSVRKMMQIEEQQLGENSDDVLETLNWLANVYSNTGDIASSIEMMRLRRDRIEARFGAEDVRTREATVNYKLYRQRHELPADLKAIEEKGNAALTRARTAVNEKKPDEALAAFREAAEAYEQSLGADSVMVANMLRDARTILVQQKNYVGAMAAAERVVKADVAGVGNEHSATLDDEAEQAFIVSLAGDRPRAFLLMREVLPRLKKHGRYANAALMLDILGREMANVDLEAASVDLKQAIEMSDLASDGSRAASLCGFMGRVARAQGKRADAEAWWYDSQWRFKGLDPVRGALEVLPELAAAYRASGRSHLELAMNQLVIEWLQKVPRERLNVHVLGSALTRLAGTQVSLGDYERASSTVAKALGAPGKGERDIWTIDARHLEARLLERAGDVAGAQQSLHAATEIAKAIAPRNLPHCLILEAQLALRRGDATSALPLCQAAVEQVIKQPTEATIEALQAQGLAFVEAGRLDDARASLKTSTDLLAKFATAPLAPQTWLEQARLSVRLGNTANIRALCDKALVRSRDGSGENSSQHAEILSQSAVLLIGAGDTATAKKLAQRSLKLSTELVERSAYVLSPRQQIGLAEAMRTALDVSLSATLQEQGHAKDLFAEIYRWKGGALIRQRALQRLRQEEGVLPFYEQLAKITSQLATGTRQISPSAGKPRTEAEAQLLANVDQLSAVQEFLETQLSASRLAFLDLESESTPTDLFQRLGPEECLVDYFIFRRSEGAQSEPSLHVLATVIRSGEVQASMDLGPLAPLRDAIRQWRSSLGSSEDARKAGVTLRTALWDPLKSDIGNAKTVLVSPDGPLGALPFAALPMNDGKYLIESYRLSVLPAPQMLAASGDAMQPGPGRKPLLALGDVNYGSAVKNPASPSTPAVAGLDRGVRGEQQFDALPGTAAEIDSIRLLHRKQGIEVDTLSRDAASEAEFRERAPHYRVLHVATHGFFADSSAHSAESSVAASGGDVTTIRTFDSGLLSGLALALANSGGDAARGDGILTASEIATIDMTGVDLAVLSACETGLGKEASGEGLLGIQRAFQIAGARSTVSSLWKVNDHTTQVLMGRFYLNRSNGLNNLDALREAQLWMLSHPKDVWSAQSTAADRGDRRVRPTAAPTESKQLAPEYWAAFTLSGLTSQADSLKN